MKWTKTQLGPYTAQGERVDFLIEPGTGKEFNLRFGCTPSAKVFKLTAFYANGPKVYYFTTLKSAKDYAQNINAKRKGE